MLLCPAHAGCQSSGSRSSNVTSRRAELLHRPAGAAGRLAGLELFAEQRQHARQAAAVLLGAGQVSHNSHEWRELVKVGGCVPPA